MTGWIHFVFLTASLLSLKVIRLRSSQREALYGREALVCGRGASSSGPADSSRSSGVEKPNPISRARHV